MFKLRLTILWGLFTISIGVASDIAWQQLAGPYGGVIVAQAFHKDGGHFALFDHSLNLSTDGGIQWQTVFEDAQAFQIGRDDLLYVQSANGLFFSSDAGASWNKLPDGLYNLQLDNMAVAGDGAFYFADGANLFVSRDRALTWQIIDYNFNNSARYVKISKSGDIFVFGNNRAFQSSSLAESWKEILNAEATIQCLFVASNNKIYASVGDETGGAIYDSIDGGQAWQATTLPYSKQLFESPQGWLLGAGATLDSPVAGNSFISLNGGGAWTPIAIDVPVYNIAVGPQGDIFVGSDGFFRSTNSGGSFQPIAPNHAHVYSVVSTSDNGLLAVTGIDSSFWRFWRSPNGGATWHEIDKQTQFGNPAMFYALKPAPGNRLWLALGYQTDQDVEIDKSVIYETQNGGAAWSKLVELFSAEANFDYDKSTMTCYAWVNGAKYFDRSEDAGKTWEPIPAPFEVGALQAASDGLVYGYSRGDMGKIRRIFYSLDSGEPGSWQKVDAPYDDGEADLFVDHMGLLYKLISQPDGDAVSLTHLYRSTDYGAAWRDILPDSGLATSKASNPPALSFDPVGGAYLHAPGYVLLSRNAGLDWDELYRSTSLSTDVQSFFADRNGALTVGSYASSLVRGEKQPYKFLPENLDGLESPVARAYGVMWVDYDADGDQDVFVVNDGKNFLYNNSGDGKFRKVSSGEIVTDDEPSRSASWADYNNDGYPDCFVTNWNAHNSLYKNLGDGTFKKITSGNIVEDLGGFRSCAWIDVNNDGHLDMYVANVSGKNILYINDGTNHWTKSNTDAIGAENDETYGLGWCDFDDDGDLDLYLANGGADKLYEQTGDLVFQLVNESRMPGNNGVSVGCSWGDYDNDGWMDLFVANADVDVENVLYHNNGDGSFSKTFADGIATDIGVSKGSAWSDVDNDGDLDLFVANNGSHFFYSNDGHGGFEKESMKEFIYYGGNSLAAAWGDGDNDGDLDLLLASYDLQTLLYKNTSASRHWINVKCIGTMTLTDEEVASKSNRSAVGAIIKLRAMIQGKPVWQTREISTQTGHAGQNSIVQHFGVGDATGVDSLIVYWPSGTVQRLGNLGVDRRVTVLESGFSAVVDKQDIARPSQFRLLENYPNPFNPETTIRYSIPFFSHVTIDLVDTRGRHLRTLRHADQAPGYYSVVWDGLDDSGRQAAGGLYFCVLTADHFRATVKMTLLR